MWVDRDGQRLTAVIENERIFGYPRLSPDGTRVALNMRGEDVWVLDLERGTETRLTEGGTNVYPIWDTKGENVTYTASSSTATFDLYSRPVDLSRPAEPRVAMQGSLHAGAWTSDDSALLFGMNDPDSGPDLWVLPVGGTPEPFLVTPFEESAPRLSPDGRWVAYLSDQSGEHRVYIRPFMGGGEVIPVSTGPAGEAIWARDGRELLFREGQRMMSAAVTPGPSLTVGPPRLLFEETFAIDLTGPNRRHRQDRRRRHSGLADRRTEWL